MLHAWNSTALWNTAAPFKRPLDPRDRDAAWYRGVVGRRAAIKAAAPPRPRNPTMRERIEAAKYFIKPDLEAGVTLVKTDPQSRKLDALDDRIEAFLRYRGFGAVLKLINRGSPTLSRGRFARVVAAAGGPAVGIEELVSLFETIKAELSATGKIGSALAADRFIVGLAYILDTVPEAATDSRLGAMNSAIVSLVRPDLARTTASFPDWYMVHAVDHSAIEFRDAVLNGIVAGDLIIPGIAPDLIEVAAGGIPVLKDDYRLTIPMPDSHGAEWALMVMRYHLGDSSLAAATAVMSLTRELQGGRLDSLLQLYATYAKLDHYAATGRLKYPSEFRILQKPTPEAIAASSAADAMEAIRAMRRLLDSKAESNPGIYDPVCRAAAAALATFHEKLEVIYTLM